MLTTNQLLLIDAPPGQPRTPAAPPVIRPVAGAGPRPQWSVMIPAYNCLGHLPATLRSVLAQAPGPAHMQIAVVDDASTDGDVQAAVAAIGGGRVAYLRQARNVGSLRNFETCLNHATGEWVHLLHGDDRVAPGFYAEITALFAQYPEAGAAFTNTADLLSEPAGEQVRDRPPIAPTAGIIPDFLRRQARGQQLETPSIVVKRRVYEQLGGFFAVHYGEDWEMWARIAAHFPVAYSPKCLAQYRYIGVGSISQQAVRNGQNVRDIATIFGIMQQYLPSDQRRPIGRQARRQYALYCLSLAEAFYRADRPTARTQMQGALALSQDVAVLYRALKLHGKLLLRYR